MHQVTPCVPLLDNLFVHWVINKIHGEAGKKGCWKQAAWWKRHESLEDCLDQWGSEDIDLRHRLWKNPHHSSVPPLFLEFHFSQTPANWISKEVYNPPPFASQRPLLLWCDNMDICNRDVLLPPVMPHSLNWVCDLSHCTKTQACKGEALITTWWTQIK